MEAECAVKITYPTCIHYVIRYQYLYAAPYATLLFSRYNPFLVFVGGLRILAESLCNYDRSFDAWVATFHEEPPFNAIMSFRQTYSALARTKCPFIHPFGSADE